MPEPTPPTSPAETPETETPTPIQETPGAQETPAPAPAQPDASQVDYQKKFSESTREAQILREQNKQKDAQIEQLTRQHPPSEQELRDAYPEWDQMMPHEQRMAKENLALRKKQLATEATLAETRAQIAWEKDLKKAVKSHPALKGREDEFEEFVMKPSHRAAPIDVLARAFLSDHSAPAPAARPGPERGSAGPKELPKAKKLSIEEAKALRETNSEEYRRQVMAGNIDDDL